MPSEFYIWKCHWAGSVNPGQDQSQGKRTVESLSQKWGFGSSSRPRRQGGHAVCREPNPTERTPRGLKGFQQRSLEVGRGRGGRAVGATGQVASAGALLPPWPPVTFIRILPSFRCSELPDSVPGLPPYFLGSTLWPCFRDGVPGGRSECGKGSRDVRQWWHNEGGEGVGKRRVVSKGSRTPAISLALN